MGKKCFSYLYIITNTKIVFRKVYYQKDFSENIISESKLFSAVQKPKIIIKK